MYITIIIRKYCYLALELKDGGDLRFHLDCLKHRFSEHDVAYLVMALSQALRHIRSKRIIHRDVKPDNIIFDQKGRPSLTDFGIAYIDYQDKNIPLETNLKSGTPGIILYIINEYFH